VRFITQVRQYFSVGFAANVAADEKR
jgi:hypothetical protein